MLQVVARQALTPRQVDLMIESQTSGSVTLRWKPGSSGSMSPSKHGMFAVLEILASTFIGLNDSGSLSVMTHLGRDTSDDAIKREIRKSTGKDPDSIQWSRSQNQRPTKS